jgi:hypothetical protein
VNQLPVIETPAADLPRSRSLVEIGGLLTLATLAFAAIAGVIAVVDTDSRSAGFGVGIGIASLIFLAGATIACGLACLVRGRLQALALGAIAAAGLSIDLIVLAVWLDIDTEAYVKAAGVLAVWSFFALIVLGLVLAVASPQRLARVLFTGALTLAVVGALISTWLIVTADSDMEPVAATPIGVGPPVGDDVLLQVLGATFVLLATFWFGALAASRLPDQTLKRTLITSPSSTT